MNFNDKLNSAVQKNNSLFSVGFDPVIDKLPHFLLEKQYPFFEFNKSIIDNTHDLVCSYKFNSAFYEARGDKGIKELKMVCDYINEKYPEIPIILDAKRGDIGNSNEAYVKYAFDYLRADALTVMPYMGIESLKPFFDRKDKGIIVGCHSSNPGAKEFQELLVTKNQSVILNEVKNPDTRSFANAQDDSPRKLYEVVAEEIVKQQGNNPNCMIFMGATFPEELSTIREIVGDMTILSPGIGVQKGTLEKTVKAGINSQGKGLIIVAVRSIIFASSGEDFAEKAREETMKLKDEVNLYRK